MGKEEQREDLRFEDVEKSEDTYNDLFFVLVSVHDFLHTQNLFKYQSGKVRYNACFAVPCVEKVRGKKRAVSDVKTSLSPWHKLAHVFILGIRQ